MASCNYCKVSPSPEEPVKSCVCQNVSYCSKECQAKDWKTHKPSCPPFVIRESPGKGRGLFATRRIKQGQVILEEYPLIIIRVGLSIYEFLANQYPFIDEDIKAKILQLHDPADSETVEELISQSPMEAKTDEMIKMFRIISRIPVRQPETHSLGYIQQPVLHLLLLQHWHHQYGG